MTKLAVIQQPPIVLNRDATLRRAVEFAAEAADAGAKLVIYPEAFVPGYPAWIWRLRPGTDWDACSQIYKRLLDNAVDLEKDGLRVIRRAAQEHDVTIVMGINERDGRNSRSTLYNTVVTVGPTGDILNRHRKLMPTNPERMVWGFGDASGLNVVDAPSGRIGSLLCWENLMPLARFALYAQGIEIHIAPTYDSGDSWLGTLQHIAREGGCWVVAAGVALRNGDIPEDLPDRDRLYPSSEDWVNPGDSAVIDPGGEFVAGPLRRQQTILYANIDPERVALSRRAFDVAGHYARPDIFTLHVNRQAQLPVMFE